MKQTQNNLFRPMTFARAVCAVCAIIMADAASAAVVQRTSATTARPTTSRAQISGATPAVRASTGATTTPAPAAEPTPAVVEEPAAAPSYTIENKSTRFDGTVSSSSSASDAAADSLAELIRQQRAALDTQSVATGTATVSATYGGNSCDANLRACMQSKCGKDFSKCKLDGDTLWGDKMDACRRDLDCTGTEYRIFAAEIKADRDMNAKIASYNSIIDCGNEYNDCIITECGINYNKCLGKTAGDAAVAKCATIAKNCTQQDSGLAGRAMEVFATLRQTAEVQIQKDEQRLYALRDQMRSVCARLGALFDERSLDCVYTVEFYADAGSTLYASKKLYAGDTFDCTQNWFGVDITTFKENAYRYTRQATSATSGMMGAGLGVAAGAMTSGMINRAIDSQKAAKAAKKAEKEGDNSSDSSDDTANSSKTTNNKNAATNANTNTSKNTNTSAPKTGNSNTETTQKTPATGGDAGNDAKDTTSAKGSDSSSATASSSDAKRSPAEK